MKGQAHRQREFKVSNELCKSYVEGKICTEVNNRMKFAIAISAFQAHMLLAKEN